MEKQQNIEYTIRPKKGLDLDLKELIKFHELFYFFTWRDIKVRYKQTFLGFLWAIIQPLLMMAIFSLFFGRTLNVPSQGIPYPLFVFSGLLIWNIFSSGLSNAGNSMVANANIIKKIYFPKIIIPISAIFVALFDFAIAFLLFIFLLLYYNINSELEFFLFKTIIYVPLSLIITVFSTFGPGCLLAALNVKYRDFRYIIPFLIQMLLFLTPVIYPVSIMENQISQVLLSLNPLSGAIELFRHAFTNTPLNLQLVLISSTSSIIFFIVGILYFKKTESFFADIA
ncbi:MAG: ABC transporter permease [Candidatus Cyclobacteriaceae bacterium M2_1C_046]